MLIFSLQGMECSLQEKIAERKEKLIHMIKSHHFYANLRSPISDLSPSWHFFAFQAKINKINENLI